MDTVCLILSMVWEYLLAPSAAPALCTYKHAPYASVTCIALSFPTSPNKSPARHVEHPVPHALQFIAPEDCPK